MRLLCGVQIGQSQRTLPCVPATRALPRKTTQPQTRRCALARHRTRAPLRAPLATRRITARASAAASERSERSGRLDALVMRLADWAKSTHPAVRPRHARTAPQDHATANTTLRPGATQNARTTSRPAGDAPHNGTRISRRERAQRAKRSAGCACYAACRLGKANAPCRVSPPRAHCPARPRNRKHDAAPWRDTERAHHFAPRWRRAA